MTATAGCVTEESLLAELATAMAKDSDRAAEICGMVFGDQAIADTAWLCRAARTIRRVYIRNPIRDRGGEPATLSPGDPRLPSIIVPTGPARRFGAEEWVR